jgi:hypothetical protein
MIRDPAASGNWLRLHSDYRLLLAYLLVISSHNDKLYFKTAASFEMPKLVDGLRLCQEDGENKCPKRTEKTQAG